MQERVRPERLDQELYGSIRGAQGRHHRVIEQLSELLDGRRDEES